MSMISAWVILRVMWWVLGKGHHTLDRHWRTGSFGSEIVMEMAMPQEHGHFVTQAA